MSENEVPLQRRFLLRSIADALGHISVQETAERLGFSYETVSRWRHKTDPGRDALRQIFLRMHGPQGGVAAYDGVEDDADEFITSFMEIRSYEEKLRTLESIRSPSAIVFLKEVGELIDGEIESSESLLADGEPSALTVEIDIPPNIRRTKGKVTIRFSGDGTTTVNAFVERIEEEHHQLFDDDRDDIKITFDATSPGRNSDGEFPIEVFWITIVEPRASDIDLLKSIISTARNSFGDDGKTLIHVKELD